MTILKKIQLSTKAAINRNLILIEIIKKLNKKFRKEEEKLYSNDSEGFISLVEDEIEAFLRKKQSMLEIGDITEAHQNYQNLKMELDALHGVFLSKSEKEAYIKKFVSQMILELLALRYFFVLGFYKENNYLFIRAQEILNK